MLHESPSLRDQALSVSELNNQIKMMLEEALPLVWVEGEISNFMAASSGHWYFSLKDNAAQVRCCLFKGSQRGVKTRPKDGMHVLVRARASVYTARGEYQLIAEHLEEHGLGKKQQAFEALKKKLGEAGWFHEAAKKTLPLYPACIGVVTSPTGAAIHDILTVLNRRYPCTRVIIYPSLVQGELAPEAIAAAIQCANARNECDVLIVGRGGGSIEDLWAFNEEVVAKAIHESVLPIVSAVGHEVDFTIADFVADKRAPTPSAAAEMLTPDSTELLYSLKNAFTQLQRRMIKRLNDTQLTLDYAEKHLHQHHPKRKMAEKLQSLAMMETLLTQAMRNHLASVKLRLGNASATLDALSPLATLARGFSVVMKDKHVITKAADLKKNDALTLTFVDGQVNGCVT